MAVAFFTHMFFPRREHDIAKVKIERSEINQKIAALNDSIVSSSKLFVVNGIDENSFSATVLSIEAEKQKLANQEILKGKEFDKLDTHYRDVFFGFPSFRLLIYNVGLGIDFLILAVVICYLCIGIRERNNRYALSMAGWFSGLMGAYFFIWILYDQQDLSYPVYMALMVTMAAIASAFGFFLSKALFIRRVTIAKLRLKIDKALDFFVEIRNVHFKNVLKSAIKTDLYDETLQEEIKRDTKSFETRMHETADELLD